MGRPACPRQTGGVTTSPPWYRDRSKRDRATVYGFAVLGVGGILLAGTLRLAEGDRREVVVTLERSDAVSVEQLGERRQLLKDDCGGLPGVSPVADRGRPSVQGRFPVRFSVRGATNAQRAALEACLSAHDDVVRGYTLEGDE